MRSKRFNREDYAPVARAVQEKVVKSNDTTVQKGVVEYDDAAVARAVQEEVVESDDTRLAELVQKGMVDSVRGYYDHNAVNTAINVNNKNPNKVAVAELTYQYQNLLRTLQEFKRGSKRQIIIPVHPGQNHFAFFLVSKQRDGSFKAIYCDPLGADNAFPIPEIVLGNLRRVLNINPNNIVFTSNAIQHCDGRVITNNHCGPFTGFIASEIANGNIRVTDDKLEIKIGRNWQIIPDLNEEESRLLGNKIRQRDYQLFSGDIINIDPLKQLKEIVIGRNQNAALTTQARKDPLNSKTVPSQPNPKPEVSLWKRFVNRLRGIGRKIIEFFKKEKEPPFIGSYIENARSSYQAVNKKDVISELRNEIRNEINGLQADRSEIIKKSQEGLGLKIKTLFNSLARSDNPKSFAQYQGDGKTSLMHSALGSDLTPSSIPPFLIEHNPSSNTMTVTTWGVVRGEGFKEFTFEGKEIDKFIQKVEEAKITGRYSIRDIAVKLVEERTQTEPVAKKSNIKKAEGAVVEEEAKKGRGVKFAGVDEVREFKKEAMPFAVRVTKSKFKESGVDKGNSNESASQATTSSNPSPGSLSLGSSRFSAITRRIAQSTSTPQGSRTR